MSHLFSQNIWLIPCYPLLGALLSVLWFPSITHRTGPRPAGYLNAFLTLIAFIQGCFTLLEVWGKPSQEILIPWLHVAGLDITLPFEVSSITIGASLLITGLNLLAQIFAIGYLEMDWGWARFFTLIGIFEGGMCALVLFNSLFFSYVMLEILTLGTYLLIGFWFNQPLVVTGARDAFLTKRVGDLLLLMGVIALLPVAGTWNYTELSLWAQTAQVDPIVITLITLSLVAGPMAKCAQFPLHLWLDEAMEGPLPATILRNAVVVSVGAWVLVKLQAVLALSPFTLEAIVVIGSVTALGSTLIAIAQVDIKRTLSYLTSAYMGLVFLAVGTQQSTTALELCLIYALGMALLVMSVGCITWNTVTQDVRQLGGLWSRRPIPGLAYLVGGAGMVALPPLGGFWALLRLAQGLLDTQPWLLGVLFLVNTLATFSLMRVFGLAFCGQPTQMTERAPEVLWAMVLPTTIVMGFTLHAPILLWQWHLVPAWDDLNLWVYGVLLTSTAIGAGTGVALYGNRSKNQPIQLQIAAIQQFFAQDLYTASLYKSTIVFAVDRVSRFIDWLDVFIVDGAVNLVGMMTNASGQGLKYSITGQTQFYALTILVSVAALGIFLIAPAWSSLGF